MRCDSRGLGGFFEAILAVMIVTSGFTVLLVSINLAQADGTQDNGGDAQEQVRSICQRLLEDERLFRPPYILLLSNSFLWSGIVEDELSGFEEYSITLIIDPESPRSILLAQKGFGAGAEGVINVRLPVNVQMTPSTIHVGILEVRVAV